VAIKTDASNATITPEGYVPITKRNETSDKLEATLGIPADAEAEINGKRYAKLSTAIEEVPDNQGTATEILILKDITLKATQEIPASKNIKLDLNKYTIDTLDAETTISNRGKLEITDTSTEGIGTIKHTLGRAIENAETLIVSGGEVSGFYCGIANGGTVKVIGGKVSATSRISNGLECGISNSGIVEVSGGTVSGKAGIENRRRQSNCKRRIYRKWKFIWNR